MHADLAAQNKRDLAYIAWGKRWNILKRIDPEPYRRHIRRDTQSSCCSDSDQFADIRRQHHRIFSHETQRYGWLNLYGGALLIPAHSPLDRHGQGRVLRHEFYLGHIMQKGGTVFYGHAPCGKVRLRQLSVRESYKLLYDAPLAAEQYFRRQSENIVRYQKTTASLGHRLDRPPRLEEVMVYAELDFEEIHTIEEVAHIMPLDEAAALPLPTFTTHFQVDYEKLGGEQGKQRTYEFVRTAYADAMQNPKACRELDAIA